MIEILQEFLPLIIVIVVLGILWFVLRYKATRVESTSEFEKLIGGDQPVVLKFFKNT